MASITSPVNLGSICSCHRGQIEGSYTVVRRVSFGKDFRSFHRIRIGRRWRYMSVCRYSVITDYIADQGTSTSLDFSRGSSKDAAVDDPLLKSIIPKPQLKYGLKAGPPLSTSSLTWNGAKTGQFSDGDKGGNNGEDKNEVIESLGEAEKLETNNKVPIKKLPASRTAGEKNGKPVYSVAGPSRKSKTMKSVWVKGNPAGVVKKVVKKPLKQEQKIDTRGKAEIEPVSPLRPHQLPQKVQPKVQAKQPVAPPSVIKKPVILNGVGAVAKSPTADAVELAAKNKEHKPILIDKFATKKPAPSPPITRMVLTPPKPRKSPPFGKSKEEFHKKSGASGGPRRRAVNDDYDEIPDEEVSELDVSIPSVAKARKGRKWTKASRKAVRLQAAKEAAPVKVEILEVNEAGMSTEELAYNLAMSEGQILGYLYTKGIKPDGVQTISKDMVKMICKEYEVEVIDADPVRVEEMAKKKEILDDDDVGKLEDRPPVVTIMGHVDHGKTTLLDYIRKSKVAASEAGGITQGIGAYKVKVPIDGKLQTCVFLDTPGHEAFGAMRARGARVTDIAIVVVAADDGIRPQTNEAIAHAKAAGVPIVIAINKIDKDGANPERVMQDLSSIGLVPVDWGGDIPMVKVSALKGENIDDLLETAMLVAELQELKANPHRNAKGTVIEASLDKSKGPIATFIVQNGTLKRQDVVVCGEAFGKIRALFDDNEKRVDEAGPSIPVQVIGLNTVPIAGDEFEVVGSLDIARKKAEERAESLRNERISSKAGEGKVTLSSFASAVSSGKLTGLDLHQLNIILKVDFQGSIEAVRQALQVLPQDNVTLKFLLQSTGDVNTSDIDLAHASKAIIFGFNVKAPGSVKSYADNKCVEIRLYRVIYELIDDVRNAMEGLLEPVEEQVAIGSAEVRAVFSSGSGRVAGCMVTEGKVVKEHGVRVVRKGKEVHVGVLDSLRRVKEIVKEVTAGLECGIGIKDFDEFEVGDTLQAFNTTQKRRTLEEASASIAAALEKVGIDL
ncbi:PREDICTED: translation initiation factor IF-2, chloroplastic-like [Ipomoea nil]|uniref:translation initiation factor IF-2, chloroplastic-like n=1 Tax=Ipomoea nil TaxID=35883 RepID=UPI000901E42C|nr:PREDICTED: translation initiation factor IF-2, chloroplastic-like [Ipomoea nil]XP_019159157.1 PREDICTED: translation initiation factor IF-2, chloroplastic-like [Ipomoea nil]